MRLANMLGLGLRLVLAAVFVAAGGAKLAGIAPMTEIFERFNLPSWFMYFTGAIECIGGAGVLFAALRVRAIAAALLCATMTSGACFHLMYDPPTAAIPAVVLTVLTGFVGVAAWRASSRNEA